MEQGIGRGMEGGVGGGGRWEWMVEVRRWCEGWGVGN